MMDAERLARLISRSMLSHSKFPKFPDNAVRIWDGRTPYGVHPVWAAMTILHEPNLPEDVREAGAEALLFHDIPEDTEAKLPRSMSPRVRALIAAMTFASSDEEKIQIWNRTAEVRMLKLYDKASNFLDGIWRPPERHRKTLDFARKLADDVEKSYGSLSVIDIIRSFKYR